MNYLIKGPGGSWDAADDGVYTITLRRRQILDGVGIMPASVKLGAFSVIIPKARAAPAAVVMPVSGLERHLKKDAEDEWAVFA